MTERLPQFGNSKEQEPLRVGSMVRHPFRDEAVPILFTGEQMSTFVPSAYLSAYERRGRAPGSYDAIQGSDQYRELKRDPRFVEVKTREGRWAEVDFSSDIEIRTLVVPIDNLERADPS